MAYIVDPINNTLIDDEKPFKKKKYKEYAKLLDIEYNIWSENNELIINTMQNIM